MVNRGAASEIFPKTGSAYLKSPGLNTLLLSDLAAGLIGAMSARQRERFAPRALPAEQFPADDVQVVTQHAQACVAQIWPATHRGC